MPVCKNPEEEGEVLYQRAQYHKGGITKLYWDYRDKLILRHIEGEAVLDIGCGEGLTLERLIQRFPDKNIRGVDDLSENIEICKKFNLPVELGSAYDLKSGDNCLDTCLLIEVVEHLSDHRKALEEAFRVLKKGGRLLLLFPNDGNFMISRLLTGKFKEAFYDAGHIRQWTPLLLRRELAETGFSVTGIKSIPFCLWPLSLHCLIIARKP